MAARLPLALVDGALRSVRRHLGFADLVEAHGGWLTSLALKLSGNLSEAQDLTQDALERALKAFDRLTPGSNVRAWLASILTNLFYDGFRRRRREGPHLEASAVEELVAHAPPEAEPVWLSLSEAAITEAVDQLNEPFRTAYRLHLEGRSYEEIAEQLDIPKATVGTRLLRARTKLRALLAPPEPGDVDE